MAEPTLTQLQTGSSITEQGCWEWQGSRLPFGYGRYGRLYTHRLAWALANAQEIPAGMVVMHTCDNPPCCNPAHLRLGTYLENAQDRDRKGRHRPPVERGNPNPALRTIGEDTIRAIRVMRASGATYRRIASDLGVSRGTVYHYAAGPRANDYQEARAS